MVFINRFKRVIILCFVFLLTFNFVAAPKKAMAGGETVELTYELYLLALAIAADTGVIANNQVDVNGLGMLGGQYISKQKMEESALDNSFSVKGLGDTKFLTYEDGKALRDAQSQQDVQSFYKVGKDIVMGVGDFFKELIAALSMDYSIPGASVLTSDTTQFAFTPTNSSNPYWELIMSFSCSYPRSIFIGLPGQTRFSYYCTSFTINREYSTNGLVHIYLNTNNGVSQDLGYVWSYQPTFLSLEFSDYTGVSTDYNFQNPSVSTSFAKDTAVSLPSNPISSNAFGTGLNPYISIAPTAGMIAAGVGLNDVITTVNPLDVVYPGAKTLDDVRGYIDTNTGAQVIPNTSTDVVSTNTNTTFFDWLLDILKQALGWFGELLKSILQGLFVPSDTYLESRVMSIKSSLQKKLPYEDYTKLFNQGYAVKGLEDITVTIYGQTVVIVKVTTYEKFRDICNAIIMAFVFFMLAIYNYNNIYKLIRGSDYVSTKKTFGNMIGNNDSKGVNE